MDSTYWYGKLEYSGTAWISLGRSSAGYMVGSDVILGLPSAGTVYLYDLDSKSSSGVSKMSDQSGLSSATIAQSGSTTTMEFTKALDDGVFMTISASGSQDFIYAYGSGNSLGYHSGRGAFALDLSSGARNSSASCNASSVTTVDTEEISTSAVLAHGALMVVAWAWLFSVGIGCAFLKMQLGDVWMNLHIAMQVLGAVASIVALIVIATEINDTTGAEHMEGDHPPLGVVALCLLAGQLIGGLLRPHKVPGNMSDYTGIRDWVWKPQTKIRVAFQYLHKLGGYLAMTMATAAMLSGISQAEEYGYISSSQAGALTVVVAIPLVGLVLGVLTYFYFALTGEKGKESAPIQQETELNTSTVTAVVSSEPPSPTATLT